MVVKDEASKKYLGEKDYVNLENFLPINKDKDTSIYYTHNCEAKQTIKLKYKP